MKTELVEFMSARECLTLCVCVCVHVCVSVCVCVCERESEREKEKESVYLCLVCKRGWLID